MVNYSDLVLPDTTYLERHDTISLLDRPISEAHAVCDAIRQPVLNPEYDTRPWQEVLVELAALLQLPAFVDSAGQRKYKNYRDFIVNWEKSPGIGFLAGWRGETARNIYAAAPIRNNGNDTLKTNASSAKNCRRRCVIFALPTAIICNTPTKMAGRNPRSR